MMYFPAIHLFHRLGCRDEITIAPSDFYKCVHSMNIYVNRNACVCYAYSHVCMHVMLVVKLFLVNYKQ